MNIDPLTLAYARMARQEAIRGWLYDPNVSVIGLGWKELEDGRVLKDNLAIRVHVKQKLYGFALEAANTKPIPDKIQDFATDVVEGTYRPHWLTSPEVATNQRARRAETMQGGISIGNERRNHYGTLGAWVVDQDDHSVSMILSNWHVLRSSWTAPDGLRIFQPGRLDGGQWSDTVAVLTRDAMDADLDAAVATLTGERALSVEQMELGPPRGVNWALPGMEVVKSGRASEVTRGRVTDFDMVVKLRYDGIERLIRHAFAVEQNGPLEEVSRGGDSGSLWLEADTNYAVGLHFAGSDQPERGLAMDIRTVLTQLNVALVVQP